MRFRCWVVWMLAVVFAAGCARQPTGDGTHRRETGQTGQAVDTGSDDGEIAAAVGTLEEVDRQIASHQGKIVVLDLWALW